MKSDGEGDLLIAVAWVARRLEKLLAKEASHEKSGQQVAKFMMVTNSKEEDAPPPDDQVLALEYLEARGAVEIGRARRRDELLDKIPSGTVQGLRDDGYDVTVSLKAFKKVCAPLRAEIENWQLYFVRAPLDYKEMTRKQLLFIEDTTGAWLKHGIEKMELKIGSRYYGLIRALDEHKNVTPMTIRELIESANKHIDTDNHFFLPKQVFDCLPVLKEKLKAENDGFFPIVRSKKTLIWRRK